MYQSKNQQPQSTPNTISNQHHTGCTGTSRAPVCIFPWFTYLYVHLPSFGDFWMSQAFSLPFTLLTSTMPKEPMQRRPLSHWVDVLPSALRRRTPAPFQALTESPPAPDATNHGSSTTQNPTLRGYVEHSQEMEKDNTPAYLPNPVGSLDLHVWNTTGTHHQSFTASPMVRLSGPVPFSRCRHIEFGGN